MPGLWEYFQGLFRKAATSSPSNPFLHALIERNEEEKLDYEHWKNTLVRRRLQDWLSDQFAIFKVLPEDIDEALDFLDTPSSKGFAIHFHKTQYSRRDTLHFMDFLKEQVLKLEYRTQISDTRTYEKGEWVETIERHYLKPQPMADNPGKLRQRFGNITIELTLRNDKPLLLKFIATVYKDHLFEEGEAFHLLLQAILAN